MSGSRVRSAGGRQTVQGEQPTGPLIRRQQLIVLRCRRRTSVSQEGARSLVSPSSFPRQGEHSTGCPALGYSLTLLLLQMTRSIGLRCSRLRLLRRDLGLRRSKSTVCPPRPSRPPPQARRRSNNNNRPIRSHPSSHLRLSSHNPTTSPKDPRLPSHPHTRTRIARTAGRARCETRRALGRTTTCRACP